jgi:hypothetical protein
VNRGNTVSVFDTMQNQYVLDYVKDKQELEQYLGNADKRGTYLYYQKQYYRLEKYLQPLE